jgi:mannose-6-phosphate isomerase-like protein (cupin superfamily)
METLSDHLDKKLHIKQPRIVEKGWGREVIFADNEEYCGKILQFNEGGKFSLHQHFSKKESWTCVKGWFKLYYFDLETGEELVADFNDGDCVTIPRCYPHQLECVSVGGGSIFEVSTQDNPYDSYRIRGGDSQK